MLHITFKRPNIENNGNLITQTKMHLCFTDRKKKPRESWSITRHYLLCVEMCTWQKYLKLESTVWYIQFCLAFKIRN